MDVLKNVTIGVDYDGGGVFRAYAYTEHGNRATAKAKTPADALWLLFSVLRDDAKECLALENEMR